MTDAGSSRSPRSLSEFNGVESGSVRFPIVGSKALFVALVLVLGACGSSADELDSSRSEAEAPDVADGSGGDNSDPGDDSPTDGQDRTDPVDDGDPDDTEVHTEVPDETEGPNADGPDEAEVDLQAEPDQQLPSLDDADAATVSERLIAYGLEEPGQEFTESELRCIANELEVGLPIEVYRYVVSSIEAEADGLDFTQIDQQQTLVLASSFANCSDMTDLIDAYFDFDYVDQPEVPTAFVECMNQAGGLDRTEALVTHMLFNEENPGAPAFLWAEGLAVCEAEARQVLAVEGQQTGCLDPTPTADLIAAAEQSRQALDELVRAACG